MTDHEIAEWAVKQVEEAVSIKDNETRQIAYYAAYNAASKARNDELKHLLFEL